MGGERNELAPGDYDDVSILQLNFPDTVVTVSSNVDDPAVFSTPKINQRRNVTVDGVFANFISDKIQLTSIEGGPAVNGAPFDAEQLDSTGNVIGPPTACSFGLSQSSNITIENCETFDFFAGANFSDIDGITITNNDIHDLRRSPISGGNAENILIEENVMYNGDAQAIRLNQTTNGVIRNNTLVSTSDSPNKAPSINVCSNVIDTAIENNIVRVINYHSEMTEETRATTVNQNNLVSPDERFLDRGSDRRQ